ncbi:MAG: organic solute transport protein 1-domain-containing protein [Monoraphidium minutum]|nr:MAG: organic solute transport protein 1-domain-containing protein [Monoraphidium minutum]
MGSLACMPWIILNLGGEMLYVLEQRLHAQDIPPAKTARDLVTTMFDRAFLEGKLFAPQPAPMDKLFDLMVMGAKYQLLACANHQEMLMVTQRHLRSVRTMATLAGAAACVDMVARAEELARAFYGRLGDGQLALMRQTLKRFFQDRRVKVSLFLAEGIQEASGRAVLPQPAPPAAAVGRVRMFGADGRLQREERAPLAVLQVDPNEFFCHPVPLGDNLYVKDRPRVTPPPRAHGGGGGSGGADAAKAAPDSCLPSRRPTADEVAAGKGGRGAPTADEVAAGKGGRGAVLEIDLLAGLVAGGGRRRSVAGAPGAGAGDVPDDGFRLNLFGDGPGSLLDTDCGGGGGGGSEGAAAAKGGGARELEFGSGHEAYRRGLAGLTLDGGGGREAGADLLELMDMAGA